MIFHAEAFAFDNHRLGVMEQPIQDGRGQGAVIVEDLGPLLKGAVRGNNDRALLIAQRDDLEQQIGAGLVNGEVAKFIKDQQVKFTGWDNLYIFFDELLDVLIEIINNPTVKKISNVPHTSTFYRGIE